MNLVINMPCPLQHKKQSSC